MKQEGGSTNQGNSVEYGTTWGKWGSMVVELGRKSLEVVSAEMATRGVLHQPLPKWQRASFPVLPGPEQPPRLWKSLEAERLRAAVGAGSRTLPGGLEHATQPHKRPE